MKASAASRFHALKLTVLCALAAAMLPAGLYGQGRQGGPAARLQTIEAEALVASARGATGLSAQGMSGFGDGWSGGAQLLWNGGRPGAVVDLAFAVEQPAVYALEMYFTHAPDYAQITFAVDQQASRAFLDTYAPRVAPPTPYQAGSFALTAGTHTLSIQVDGKHAQSSGYLVGLDRIRLYPTAALAEAEGRAGPAAARGDPAVVAEARNPAVGGPAPGAPAGTASAPGGGQGAECASSCLGNVSTVSQANAQGQCQAWFRVPCDPYGCDAKSGMCRNACASDAQCGQGSKCNTNTGMCTSAPPACADAVTVKSANGQSESCLPYKCRAGACRESCDGSSDCASGHSCNVYGRCVTITKKP